VSLKTQNPRNGMTLIEMLITVAVVAVVAAIAVPLVINQVNAWQQDSMKTELTVVGPNAIGRAIDDNAGVMTAIPSTLTAGTTYTIGTKPQYRVKPGVSYRVVMTGAGTTASPYTGYCVTGYSGGVNLQILSTTPGTVTSGSCGLYTYPLTAPDAPTGVTVTNGGTNTLSVT
jgi:prepilin-type N-terminal cleavage/methylation domain-containing protein